MTLLQHFLVTKLVPRQSTVIFTNSDNFIPISITSLIEKKTLPDDLIQPIIGDNIKHSAKCKERVKTSLRLTPSNLPY